MKILSLILLALGSALSAQATVFEYVVFCTGAKESPVNGSPGTAAGSITYDNVAHTLTFRSAFTALQGNTTQSHIHAATTTPFTSTSGIALGNSSLPGFPLSVTNGVYTNTIDLTLTSVYPNAYVTANGGTAGGAEAALAAALAAGRAYWNIHTLSVGAGEIRSFPILNPQIKVVGVKVGANVTLTTTLAATNGLTLVPEYTTNLITPNWQSLTPLSSGFLNGTNEMICGTPSANPAYFRVRAQLVN